MKKHIITFFNKPKLAISIFFGIAIIVSGISYKMIHTKKVYSFVPVTLGSITQTDIANKNLTLAFVSGGKIQSVLVHNGDSVKTGQVLATLDNGTAQGSINQAKAAYALAQANYQKVLNGATSSAIDVAKAAVKTAQVNLDQATKQQTIAVANAYSKLLSSGLEITTTSNDTTVQAPTLSGSYTKTQQGDIIIQAYPGGDNGYFNASGMLDNYTGTMSTTVPQPIADTGLFITFSTKQSQPNWVIHIPNKNSVNYTANYNAYQTALQTKDQVLALAQAGLDQANAALINLQTAARPEDVATAKAQVESAFGAVQIAQANYNNTIITAPNDGVIHSVAINPGQIITPNSAAITMLAQTTTKDNVLLIPKTSVIYKNGKTYAVVHQGNTNVQKEITIGITDQDHVEVVSGLSQNDKVAVLQ
ncbi:MAG: biotin/lipoyl-binding protein [bacterium]